MLNKLTRLLLVSALLAMATPLVAGEVGVRFDDLKGTRMASGGAWLVGWGRLPGLVSARSQIVAMYADKPFSYDGAAGGWQPVATLDGAGLSSASFTLALMVKLATAAPITVSVRVKGGSASEARLVRASGVQTFELPSPATAGAFSVEAIADGDFGVPGPIPLQDAQVSTPGAWVDVTPQGLDLDLRTDLRLSADLTAPGPVAQAGGWLHVKLVAGASDATDVADVLLPGGWSGGAVTANLFKQPGAPPREQLHLMVEAPVPLNLQAGRLESFLVGCHQTVEQLYGLGEGLDGAYFKDYGKRPAYSPCFQPGTYQMIPRNVDGVDCMGLLSWAYMLNTTYTDGPYAPRLGAADMVILLRHNSQSWPLYIRGEDAEGLADAGWHGYQYMRSAGWTVAEWDADSRELDRDGDGVLVGELSAAGRILTCESGSDTGNLVDYALILPATTCQIALPSDASTPHLQFDYSLGEQPMTADVELDRTLVQTGKPLKVGFVRAGEKVQVVQGGTASGKVLMEIETGVGPLSLRAGSLKVTW